MTDITINAQAGRPWVGPMMVLGGGIAIGFAPIGLRLGLDDLGPQAIAFWRYAFAAPVLFLLVFLFEKRPPRVPNKYILLGGICFTIDIALWHWSLTLTSVSNSTFLVNLGNICVGFAAWVFLRERPAKAWFIAIGLALAGAAALSLGGQQGGQGSITGDVIAIGAAVMVSFYLLASKLARRSLGGLETVFWLTLVEVGAGSLVVLVAGETFLPADLSGFSAPLFLGIGVHVIGQGLIITGLGRTPTAIAGILVLIQPVIAAAVSWQLFNESLTVLQAGGSTLILVAVWLAQRGRRVQAID